MTTADLAILGSSMPWTQRESDTGRIAWTSGPYRILSEGDNPRYWTATVRLDRDRVQLGAGAGDLGLAKCVRLCERHAQQNSGVVSSCESSPGNASQLQGATLLPTSDPSSNLPSPQQQQLL